MRLALLLAAGLVAFFLIPTAAATDPLVTACLKDNGCSGGHDVCVYGFHWVPQCADLPEKSQVCYVPQQSCVGHLVCYKDVCVPDPCYTTMCF
jgi:hypothetical protein